MKRILSLSVLIFSVFLMYSQNRTCGTMQYLEFQKEADNLLHNRMLKNEILLQKYIKNNTFKSNSIITIPVVVHIVYNNSNENISDAQIQSQIDILNEDFRRLNSDASNTPSAFQAVAADCEIEFCLASVDPNGNSTNGITRTSTSQSSFSTNDGVKYTSSGGIDAWNTSNYLNMWVCDLSGGLLGYAQFPGGPSSSDGVVCDYAYFGDIGTATAPFNKGRTTTHEVGHWLNLRHIWGDSYCGNDYCNDTPEHSGSNYGCPSYPSYSNCSGNGSNGDMFMNYMDYTDDACMNMFSQDQKTRMLASITNYRSGLLTSNGCGTSSGCTDINAFNYDASATIDDGSCCYVSGCMDPLATNYNSSACFDGGNCVYPVYGCTDPSANNYDPLATADDGSCCYTSILTIDIITDNYPTETSWQLIDDFGTVYASINSGDLTSAFSSYSWDICLDDLSCYSFVISDTYGDGMCCGQGNGGYTLTLDGTVLASGGSFLTSDTYSDIGSCIVDVYGCMNSSASNYDPLATNNIAYGGIVDPNVGTGTYFTGNQHLVLDCNQPSKIVSAVVYTQASNTVTFELRDSGGGVIDDTTLSLIAGGQRIDLNFDVPVGTDYQLGVSASGSGLWRNNGGVSYPYDIGGLINIKYSSASSNPFGFYYFFYDIEVQAVCTGLSISGCTDPLACNYDVLANIDDGSCTYAVFPYDCAGNCVNDTDGDGICDENEIPGCTDPAAFNYDPTATDDDGSCIPIVAGCLDPLASNYCSTCNTDDGTCVYSGCTDPLADNYDANATVDDGSCTYSTVCDAVPTGLNAWDITDTRFRLGWDNMNTSNCLVLKYQVRYRETGTTQWTLRSAGSGNGLCIFGLNNVEKLMINFNPSTTYDVRIRAQYCGSTTFTSWTPIINVTMADLCPDLTNVTVQTYNGQPNKARFDWDTTGVYEFARLYTRVNTIGAPWTVQGGFGIYYPTFFKNIFNFTPGETYRVQANSFCSSTMASFRGNLTTPVVWTQPGGSSRIEGGVSIVNLAVYPNPSRDVFNVSFTSEEVQDLKVRVLNIVGEEIISEDLQQFVGEYTKQIDLATYSNGIYFLEIETNDGIINKKLILQ